MEEEKESEYIKLPIEERCQHKLWKARVNGYEAATKLFNDLDEKSPEWTKYLGLVKKFVTDSNAVAQEKGLDAVLVYVENAFCAGKTCGEVMGGLISKCLGAPKIKTREKAIEIIMMYIEIEKYEIVQDELIKGFSVKTPKVVCACIQALRQGLRDFGSKTITIKPIMKHIVALLEDREKGVRDEAKLLLVEIYRWVGAAIKPQLTSLKPVQMTELDAEFEKLGNQKPVQSRFLRSQQDLKAKMQKVTNGVEAEEEDGDDVGPAEEIDPLELMQPVDILSKLPKDFYDKCDAKKWQERKEAMDLLQQLTSNLKLESGDYSELVKTLRKIISKDTNVMVIAVAGKCVAGLANGLKKKFQIYSGHCTPVILEKFKEKKQNVVSSMREAIDAVFLTTTLEAMLEDVVAALDNKNPAIKAETASFLARCFKRQNATTLNKKLLKPLSVALLKTLNEPDPIVRDNSAEALGTAMKVVGEKAMMPMIPDVDAMKMAKIKEFFDKAEIIGQKKGPKIVKPVETSDPKEVPKGIAPKKVPDTKPISKPASASASRTGVASGKGANTKAVSVTKTKSVAAVDPLDTEFTERELSDQEAEEKIAALFAEATINGLVDSNWKTRVSSLEAISEKVKSMDKENVPSLALVKLLAKKPGFKDNNFQALKLKFDLVAHLAALCNFSRKSAQLCIEDLSEKIGDVKTGSSAAAALTAMAEATKLDFISSQVLDAVFTQKNPKNQSEAMTWLANAIKEFGFVIQVKPVIDHVKKALSATNPAVRTSCITLAGVIYLYMGPTLRVFFENEKSALLQQIDAEFEKLQGVNPPAPTRCLAPQNTSGEDNEDENANSEAVKPIVNLADLLPRTDISNLLQPTLLAELGDKNWKTRGEALQKLTNIIQEAKFITANLGDLPTPLKARLADSNKNLAIHALTICQSLATAMGPGCVKYVRNIGPAILATLGDSKNTVRAAAIGCLNCWVAQCTLAPFVEGDMLTEVLRLENPNLRTELYGWLSETLPAAKNLSPDLASCVPYLFAAIEDRSADVRKKAQDAVLPFMVHLGYEQMVKNVSKLKPASKVLVMAVLEKTKPNLPAKCPPKAKAVVRPGTAPAPSVASKNDSGVGNSDSAPNSKVAPPSAKGRMVRSTSKGKLVANKAVAPGKKKEDDLDTTPLLQNNNMKDQRITDEQKLKVLKWNFTTPREEFYELLKDQMTAAGFNPSLHIQLFHNDFKFHIKAIDSLNECLETMPEATVANLDLVLKWLALRFFDTNPSVLLKGLEYLHGLFILVSDMGYNLHDYEAISFLPYLILKAGDPKDTVRQAVRAIFKRMYRVYPASKIFPLLLDGLKSKNARQRTECLEELGCLIETYKMAVCQPNVSVALKEIARQISDRDNSVRNAALNTMALAYFTDTEKFHKFVGPISDKDTALLEERIKRLAKTRVAVTAAESPPKQSSPPEGRIKPTRAATAPTVPEHVKRETQQQEAVQRRPNANTAACRPVSGAFTLDLEHIEQMLEEKTEQAMPKLIKLDLGDLDKPVKLPETRMRPPSPIMRLSGAHDTALAMDLLISQVASNDVNASLNSLKQLDEFLKDEARAEALITRVDQLLVSVSIQYRSTYTKSIGMESLNKECIIELYRNLTMTLVSLFYHRSLARRASKDVLRDLIYNLVTVILDSRLNDIEDGPQVIRAVNVLVVKIVEKSNHTNVTSALIKLLFDCVAKDKCSTKFTELIMKCLWKMIRLLPEIKDDLDLDRILLDVHLFLKVFPTSQWKERSSDVPLRTIKTLLHTLATEKGNKIMGHLNLIDNIQDSEIEPYLQKVLKGRAKHRTSNEQIIPNDNQRKDNRNSPGRLSKTTHEILAEIFKKIGSKEATREGLADLYEFRKRFPEADYQPFLRRSSQFFQNYIERGLRNIELDKEGRGCNLNRQTALCKSTGSIPAAVSDAKSLLPELDSADAEQSPDFYWERLKMLRTKCGFDNADIEGPLLAATNAKVGIAKAMSSESHISEEIERTTTMKIEVKNTVPRSSSSEAIGLLTSNSPGNLDDLLRRLEKVKNSNAI